MGKYFRKLELRMCLIRKQIYERFNNLFELLGNTSLYYPRRNILFTLYMLEKFKKDKENDR